MFARVIDEEMEKNHVKVFILRFQIEKTNKLFLTEQFPSLSFEEKLDEILAIQDKGRKTEHSAVFCSRQNEELKVFNGEQVAKVYDDKEEILLKNQIKKQENESDDSISNGRTTPKELVTKADEEKMEEAAKAEEKEKKLKDIANNSGLDWWVKPKDMKTPP